MDLIGVVRRPGGARVMGRRLRRVGGVELPQARSVISSGGASVKLGDVEIRYMGEAGDSQPRGLAGVSFSIEPGELLVICAPFGAHNAALLHVMCALLVTSRGQVRIAGC